ncbi:MAG: hypothetical protein ABSG64_02575 [Solirubrobacteraceae bacterium]|jgi:hypothetical protein
MSTPLAGRLRITQRGVQIALGCLWLLVGLLQFQSYMYTHAFLAQIVEPAAQGSPAFIADPILTMAHFYGHDQVLWNTLAGELQCAIGLALILNRKTVRAALFISFFWAFWVWWLGEGLGMVFSSTPVSPLMGAPGAVLIYGLIGLLVWPTSRVAERSAAGGGPIGDRGGRIIWTALWVEAAYLWLLNVDRAKNAIHDQIAGMASGAPRVLATWESSVAAATKGHGETIAVVLAILSVALAAGVWTRLRPLALGGGIVLALAYWVIGQSLGGPFWIGNATDVNSGPLFVLLALALMPQARSSHARL